MGEWEDILWISDEVEDSIVLEDWGEIIHECVWEFVNKARVALNGYEWMRKIQIEVNWEEKETWLDDENLKVDSSFWLIKEIDWEKVKINEEKDIIEYLEWKYKWNQLFNWYSAIREAKKQWKRLPFFSKNNREFESIINKIWEEEFVTSYNGFYDRAMNSFFHRGEIVYFLSGSLYDEHQICYLDIIRGGNRPNRYWCGKYRWMSVRLVKD